LSKSYSFLDISNNYTYKNELDKAVDLGIIEGKPNGKFEPYSLLKRSESAKILIKILNLYGEKDLESAVLSVANTYLNNPDVNIISRAKEDEDFKKNYIRYANSLGVNVEKTINNVKMNIENLTSNIANCVATYDVTFTTTYPDGEKKIKTYDGKCILHLLRKNNEWKIYRADENFFIKDKVNLTWEVFINPPSYAPYGVNVISPTWFELTEDNSYKNSYSVYSDLSLNLYLTDKSTKKYVDYAKNNGYDLWIAYRNDFNKYNTEKFLKSNAAKEKALKLVIESVLKNKAEGINLDFENMTNKYDYARHVREVVLASHALGLITSVDITKYEKTSLSWSMCFDRDYIGKICDYTALMAYDEYGSHSTSSGSTASLSWVEDSIKTTLNEVENRKLILGIPFYVRYWQEKNGKVIKTSAISMERANEIIKENNAKKVIKDGQYVATWQKDGFTFSIYLEDEFSVKNRVNLINKYNLSGVASWRRGFETKNIWKTINDTMQ
jgi:spore germination protein YaaH